MDYYRSGNSQPPSPMPPLNQPNSHQSHAERDMLEINPASPSPQKSKTTKEGHLSQPFFPSEEVDSLQDTWDTNSENNSVSMNRPPPARTPVPPRTTEAPVRRGRRQIPLKYGKKPTSSQNMSTKSAAFSWTNILSFKSSTKSVNSLASTDSRNTQLMPAFNPQNNEAVNNEDDKDRAKAQYLQTQTGKILQQQGLPEVKKREDFPKEKKPFFGCFSFMF